MKPKRWHKWVLEITEVGEKYSAKQLQEKLYNLCLEKEGRGTTYVPPSNSVASFLSRTDKFVKEETQPHMGFITKTEACLWKRVK